MNRMRPPRLILREAVIALLCALMVLFPMAQGRAFAAKSGTAHDFALCLMGETPDSSQQNDHDCAACRLTSAGAALPLPVFALVRATFSLQRLDRSSLQTIESSAFLRPWLRGPPGQA